MGGDQEVGAGVEAAAVVVEGLGPVRKELIAVLLSDAASAYLLVR